jgi:hypothetical protein
MFTCNVVPSGSDTSAVLWDAYLDSIYTSVIEACTTNVVFYSYEVQQPVGLQWETIDEVAFNYTGVNTGEALPNAVALVLLGKATGIKHVGRKFFSGISEAFAWNNTIATGVVARAAMILAAYITPFTGLSGGVITPGVRDNAGVFHAFVGGMVSSLLGSMRRRKPGLGI